MSYIPINPAALFDSPVFTGDPTAPTPTAGDNDTSIATTAFVTSAIVAGGAFVDAPSDGSLYGRRNAGWTKAAPLASPGLTGNPTAPTPTVGDNGASIATTAFVTTALATGGGPPPATVPPLMDGAAAVGTTTKYAREDHVHPSDTSRATITYVDSQDAFKAPLASPSFTGTPAAPTAAGGTNTTQIATTAFVTTAVAGVATVPPATVAPLMDGTAAVGAATKYAREDHVHPSDTSRATVTYVDTQDALRATVTYVDGQDALKAPLASPTFTGTPAAPTATVGTNSTQIATTAFVSAAMSAAGSISEAPNDGQYYSRRNLGWSISPGGLTDAPNDGALYGRQSITWAKGVKLAGDTMTGLLVLSADPSVNLGAATKQYVDGKVVAPATVAPIVDSTATVGVATKYAREDHVHPLSYTAAALTKTDDTNVTLTLGGTPATALLKASSLTLGWAGTLSTTRGGLGLNAGASNGVPLFASGAVTMTGTTGTGNVVRAADPVFTGNPTAPTPTAGDNDTSIATTAFVTSAIATAVVPATATPIMDATGTVGTATKYAREDHIHPKSWTQLTQAAYDALTPPNANMLYVIVG